MAAMEAKKSLAAMGCVVSYSSTKFAEIQQIRVLKSPWLISRSFSNTSPFFQSISILLRTLDVTVEFADLSSQGGDFVGYRMDFSLQKMSNKELISRFSLTKTSRPPSILFSSSDVFIFDSDSSFQSFHPFEKIPLHGNFFNGAC
jgi:hypothetical protein